jgi:hypothetical protein
LVAFTRGLVSIPKSFLERGGTPLREKIKLLYLLQISAGYLTNSAINMVLLLKALFISELLLVTILYMVFIVKLVFAIKILEQFCYADSIDIQFKFMDSTTTLQ